jgi:integrase/recombinase XerD
MIAFVQHVVDYLQLRRSLGYKLHDHARLLRRFAAHLDAIGAERATIELALSWALEPEVSPGTWSRRCDCSSYAASRGTWPGSTRGPRSRPPG